MYINNFPTVYVETEPHAQYKKIQEELSEFATASGMWSESHEFDPLDIEACCELMDTIQACETMLGMYNGGIIQAAWIAVQARNSARGYYDKPDSFDLDMVLRDLPVELVSNDEE